MLVFSAVGDVVDGADTGGVTVVCAEDAEFAPANVLLRRGRYTAEASNASSTMPAPSITYKLRWPRDGGEPSATSGKNWFCDSGLGLTPAPAAEL